MLINHKVKKLPGSNILASRKYSMNNAVRERRKIVISNVRISPETIRQLAAVIDSEADQEAESAVFSVDAMDNSSYESQSSAIFDRNGLLEKKPMQKVTMQYRRNDFSKNIEVQIIQTVAPVQDNYVSVSGDDSLWVNGMISKMTEILTLSEQVPRFVAALEHLSWVFFIATMVLYFRFIIFYGITEAQGWFPLFCVLGIPIATLYSYTKAYEFMKSLWPAVELQTGAEYMNSPRRARNITWQIFAVVLAPILIGIGFEIYHAAA